MADIHSRQRAIDLLRAKPHRDIYEAGDSTGKRGIGLFYVTYTGDEVGGSPELDREDVRLLLESGHIEELYPGAYCLRGLRNSRMANRPTKSNR